ncbi:MAG: hypothetical protein ACREBD_36555, partial [Blastocatellia bacterium]
MLLALSNGESFATGANLYSFDPVPGEDVSARIILQVLVEGQLTSAVLDTGAPYLICSPSLSRHIGFDAEFALSQHEILIRGYRVKGSLYRINLELIATEGEELTLEVMAFVPDPEEAFNFPTFLGFWGCLE